MVEFVATINWEDGALRLYCSDRVSREDYIALRKAGFANRRGETVFKAAYTVGREQFLSQRFGVTQLEHDNTDLSETDAERAERYSKYAGSAWKEYQARDKWAENAASMIPFGQPILVGHHSERRMRNHLERIHQNRGKAIQASKRADYWQRRAAKVYRRAEQRHTAPAIHRRINELERLLRIQQRYAQQSPKSMSVKRWIWFYQNRIAFEQALLATIPKEQTPLTKADVKVGGAILRGTTLSGWSWSIIERVNQKTVSYTSNRLKLKELITNIMPGAYLTPEEVRRAHELGLAEPHKSGGFTMSCTPDALRAAPIPRSRALVLYIEPKADRFGWMTAEQREKVEWLLKGISLRYDAIYREKDRGLVVLQGVWLEFRTGEPFWIRIGTDGSTIKIIDKTRPQNLDLELILEGKNITSLGEDTRTMHTLYTLGYAGVDSAKLAEFINEKGWRVFDTRFNPRSRQPQWNWGKLNEAMKKYEHVAALGNVNYKNGGEIKLVDEALGVDAIKKALLQEPVVLLCGCKDLHTCHRSYIAERAREQLGCEVIHLTPLDVQPRKAPVKPTQETPLTPTQPDEKQGVQDGYLLIQHGMDGFAPDKLAAKPQQLKLF